jgi:hypothetical protein
MATGDVADIKARLRSLLPPWFPAAGSAPVVDGVLAGIATLQSFIYGLIAYARTQARIGTASGAWLDLIAWDFLGPTFTRRASESDGTFQARILAFLLIPRNTLAGITAMLIALTGRAPAIIEPATNVGGWDIGYFAFDSSGCWGGTQLSITAFRPPGQGIPLVDGFDGYAAGWDVGTAEWSDASQYSGQVTDAEITLRVRQWVAAGVNYRLSISS